MTEKQETLEPRRRRTRAEVERLVAEFHRSGTTQKQFCLNHRLALSTLQRYLHIEPKKQKAPAQSKLVAVEVANSSRLRDPEVSCGLALVWTDGRKLEVHRGFDGVTLQRLLDVLDRRR
jgi:hypothetical protein